MGGISTNLRNTNGIDTISNNVQILIFHHVGRNKLGIETPGEQQGERPENQKGWQAWAFFMNITIRSFKPSASFILLIKDYQCVFLPDLFTAHRANKEDAEVIMNQCQLHLN